jgi:hypothetical protein
MTNCKFNRFFYGHGDENAISSWKFSKIFLRYNRAFFKKHPDAKFVGQFTLFMESEGIRTKYHLQWNSELQSYLIITRNQCKCIGSNLNTLTDLHRLVSINDAIKQE